MRLRLFPVILLWLVAGLTLASCDRPQQEESPAECSFFEAGSSTGTWDLITEVPEAEPWCGRIPALERHRVSIGDAELHVEIEGRGRPMVLVSGGYGGSHHLFHPWFSRVARHVQVIYYDQRGCGESDSLAEGQGYSIEQAVSDLDALRQALELDDWVVLGHGLGGLVAQVYTILHPERVSALVLVASQAGLPGTERTVPSELFDDEEWSRLRSLPDRVREYAREVGLSSGDEIVLAEFNRLAGGYWRRWFVRRPEPTRLARTARLDRPCASAVEWKLYASGLRWDLTEAFRASPIPVLIVEGARDRYWRAGRARKLRINHPGARVVVIPDAGHLVFEDDPDRFFRQLSRFLRRLPPVPATEIERYQAYLETWMPPSPAQPTPAPSLDDFRHVRDEWLGRHVRRPDWTIGGVGWGMESSRILAALFEPLWLEEISNPTWITRVGLALYDVGDYERALEVFEYLAVRVSDDELEQALALLWQGHMLDLLGRREAAVVRYQIVENMNLRGGWIHDQYGLRMLMDAYPKERISEPFQRIENNLRE